MSKILRLSNSRLDLFEACPAKYKFRYVDNLKGNYTASPLLFGSAMDAALNYILESLRDGLPWKPNTVQDIFAAKMREWTPEKNRLDFFKGDVPEELKECIEADDPLFQVKVWNEMFNRGLDCINVYIKEILPLFKRIIDVQVSKVITNASGDEFIVITDFIVEMMDGRIVLMDNKTASKKYPKKSVVDSQQLSLYLEQFPDIKLAGYCVLIKDPAREKGCKFQIIIDEIPEETTADAYERLDRALKGIQAEEFPVNLKNCFSFRKVCEFENLCKYNDPTGLIPNR